MPIVLVQMLEGRTAEQKRALVRAMTDCMVEICGATAAGTTVVIEEHARTDWATGGVLVSDRDASREQRA